MRLMKLPRKERSVCCFPTTLRIKLHGKSCQKAVSYRCSFPNLVLYNERPSPNTPYLLYFPPTDLHILVPLSHIF